MKSSVRNRMAALLINAFNDSGEGLALEWLAVLCKTLGRRKNPTMPLEDLFRSKGLSASRVNKHVRNALERFIGEGELFQLRRHDHSEAVSGCIPTRLEGIPWMIEPHPEVRAALAEVSERAGVYVRLLWRMKRLKIPLHPRDPLRRAVAQAALCFNAGLFFEAHEHLELYWAAQPKGPLKQFLQGIIQISVGFHHGRLGKYDGSINQLGKGLEKTVGNPGESLGLDCDAFLPRVACVREAIVRRGRAHMVPLTLAEIPRIRFKI